MQKKYLFILLAVIILGLTLIPLNLFVLFLPEWITVFFAAASVLLLVLFYLKANGKLPSKIIMTAVTVLSAGFMLFDAYCNPYWNSVVLKDYGYSYSTDQTLTFAQAKADTDYMMKYLNKVHPVFMNGEPASIRTAYGKAIDRLKNQPKITVTVLHQQLQSILSVLLDGHTTTYVNAQNPRYLKQYYRHKQSGDTLVQINGLSIDALYAKKTELFSCDVDSYGISDLKQYLLRLDGLRFLGINPDGVRYTYKTRAGKSSTEVYHASDFVTYDEYLAYNHITKAAQKPFVSYKIYSGKSTAVLTLNECNDNDEYRSCLNAMFKEVKAKGIKNVAVDLRNNGGGNSAVADEFLHYLNINSYDTGSDVWRLGFLNIPSGDGRTDNKKHTGLTFKGKVYVLTSVDTFSSAMLFTEYIKDNKLGKIIGEAPGENVTGYGEISIFSLPNSKLLFQVSSKRFFRIDKTARVNQIIPDIACSSKDALNVLLKTVGN